MKLLRHPHIVRLYQVGSILLPVFALYLAQAKLYVTLKNFVCIVLRYRISVLFFCR